MAQFSVYKVYGYNYGKVSEHVGETDCGFKARCIAIDNMEDDIKKFGEEAKNWYYEIVDYKDGNDSAIAFSDVNV